MFFGQAFYVNEYGILGIYEVDKDQIFYKNDNNKVMLNYKDCLGKERAIIVQQHVAFQTESAALDYYENKTNLDKAEAQKILDKEIQNVEKALQKIKEVRGWNK